MGSSFFGLNIASQGLYTYQSALNVTNHNISNSGVEGYSRQYADIRATRPLPNGMRGMVGTGVEVLNIKQYRSTYLDDKFWSMNTDLGQYTIKEELIGQIEMLMREPSDSGYSTYFSDMFDRLQALSNNPGDQTARMNFVESSQTFAAYFNNLSSQMNDYQRDANFGVKTSVDRINFYSGQIAAVNNQIQNLELNQNIANDLRDERVRLIDELSKIINIDAKELTDINGKKSFHISIGGQSLVDGNEANFLEAIPRKSLSNVEDVPDLYDVYWKASGNPNLIGDVIAGAGTNVITINNFNTTDIETTGKILVNGVEYDYTAASYDTIADEMTFTLDAPTPVGVTGVEIRRDNIGRRLYLEGTGVTGELKGYFDVRDGNNNSAFKGTVSAGGGTNLITVTGISEHDIPTSGHVMIDNGAYRYTDIAYNDLTGEMTFTLDSVNLPPVGATNVAVGFEVGFKGIPYYISKLNEFVRTVAKSFNEIHEKGNGGTAGELFAFKGFTGVPGLDEANDFTYNQMTIGNFQIAPDILDDYDNLYTAELSDAGESANDLLIEMINLRHDTDMFKQGEPDNFMQAVISEMAIDGAKAKSFREGQQNLTQLVINQRESFSGVNLNEETADMIRFQQAYQLSAKMISVMDEVYDVMINQLKR